MGVKSLWTLLEPVGRPVPLETMEGKSMAIDSSIWIYQFQATMRDKEGRGLVNAHVVGFLRRISKLLFYGIKPVFVFDGGAPALKRATIAERKSKKSGAAASHAKVAERLLAAHMRREALSHAQVNSGQTSNKKPGVPTGPVVIDENTVYLEDLESNAPRTPAKPVQKNAQESPPSSKKKRWHDHDPYKLPDVNMEEAVAKATRSAAPDPRLATEDELRMFIEEMHPEDFDVTSSAFRELPTEVQYEIIGDLRLKSRQTSYTRLQNMLKNSKTPLDFSKEQIKNLKQRNALTQQLLTTTDSIGKAHVEIPIRIASERNKQYLLIKNEGEGGGWILGVRDEGTRAKPIEIDQDPKPEPHVDEDSDMDMEEVPISNAPPIDSDLREYRRYEALSALATRYTPKKLAPLTTKPPRPRKKPLFQPEGGDHEHLALDDDDGLDPELITAIQESLDDQESQELLQAIEASKREGSRARQSYDVPGSNVGASSSRQTIDDIPPATPAQSAATLHYEHDDLEDMYASPTRLETALSIANAGPKKSPTRTKLSFSESNDFGAPTLLLPAEDEQPRSEPEPVTIPDSDEEDMEEVPVDVPQPSESLHFSPSPAKVSSPTPEAERPAPIVLEDSDDEDEMEEVLPQIDVSGSLVTAAHAASDVTVNGGYSVSATAEKIQVPSSSNDGPEPATTHRPSYIPTDSTASMVRQFDKTIAIQGSSSASVVGKAPPTVTHEESSSDSDSEAEQSSRPASPAAFPPAASAATAIPDEDWDAAQEMDPLAEESEYAQFMSQVRGRNLDDVRKEIDDEIRSLNQQKKVAMRDSEDITQQMISQIMMMLRLFGIPYITAPMEAEAQCAELLSLGLVDGIITDDSDVFLFGGLRVLKNMFNQSKTVECFLLSDLERELGLDRDKLIRLAYLLGSDYTDGLPGVGPVVAMELLTEFPGPDGLHQFREWWRKVQSGRDTPEDNKSKFRKRFKKRFKDLYLPEDWPNGAVRDAYYHPTVDSSEEPFKWGLPDLDALRQFFNAELGWGQSKVDDILLPIIHKMGKRNLAGNVNRQGNLNTFFDVPTGGGAPRKRQAYASKRLQQVVSDFRKQQAANAASSSSSGNASESEDDEGEGQDRPKKRRKRGGEAANGRGKAATRGKRGGRGRGRGRGRGGSTAKQKKAEESSRSESEHSSFEEPLAQPEPTAQPPKLRPRPRPAYKTAEPEEQLGPD